MVVGVRDVVVVEVAGIVDGDVSDVTGGAEVPADSDASEVEFAQAVDATMIDNSKARVRMGLSYHYVSRSVHAKRPEIGGSANTT
jgi:hypothetical protein